MGCRHLTESLHLAEQDLWLKPWPLRQDGELELPEDFIYWLTALGQGSALVFLDFE